MTSSPTPSSTSMVDDARRSNLEGLLRKKDDAYNELHGRYEQLKTDFAFNLTVINDRDQEIQTLENSIQQLEAHISARDSELAAIRSRVKDVEMKKSGLEKSVQRLEVDVSARRTEVGTLRERLKEVEERNIEVEKKLNEYDDNEGKLLSRMNEMQQQENQMRRDFEQRAKDLRAHYEHQVQESRENDAELVETLQRQLDEERQQAATKDELWRGQVETCHEDVSRYQREVRKLTDDRAALERKVDLSVLHSRDVEGRLERLRQDYHDLQETTDAQLGAYREDLFKSRAEFQELRSRYDDVEKRCGQACEEAAALRLRLENQRCESQLEIKGLRDRQRETLHKVELAANQRIQDLEHHYKQMKRTTKHAQREAKQWSQRAKQLEDMLADNESNKSVVARDTVDHSVESATELERVVAELRLANTELKHTKTALHASHAMADSQVEELLHLKHELHQTQLKLNSERATILDAQFELKHVRQEHDKETRRIASELSLVSSQRDMLKEELKELHTKLSAEDTAQNEDAHSSQLSRLQHENEQLTRVVSEMRQELERVLLDEHSRGVVTNEQQAQPTAPPAPPSAMWHTQVVRLREHNKLLVARIEAMVSDVGGGEDQRSADEEVHFLRQYVAELNEYIDGMSGLLHQQDNTNEVRELRHQLKQAHSHLKRMVREREQLMEVSNMLRADLGKARHIQQLEATKEDAPQLQPRSSTPPPPPPQQQQAKKNRKKKVPSLKGLNPWTVHLRETS